MSTGSENEFDLEKLFLPAWAQEPSSAKQYAKYEGVPDRMDRRDERRGPRPPRRDGPSGRRPDGRGQGERRGPGRPDGGRGRPPGGERQGGGRPAFRRSEERERRPAAPLPEIELSLIPDEKGVESIARQIKVTGRAYPLFDIAQMILQKPERHSVVFKVKKNPEGQPVQPLFVCALDDTLWLSENEAVDHILKKHFATFYQAERTPTEPPKGKYTFVAQCGISGVVLGPPNYHDYQNQLRKIHAERFSRMPFEDYKARVRIVREEAVVKKWVDDQSWKTEYICLNLPEPLRLENMEAVEKHFREVHKDNIIKSVESHTLSGASARNLRSPELLRLVRSVWEDQRRFPLQIATVLSQQFASHGLQFFKVNKTVTHVSVARPHYLDLDATPVSEGVKHIVNFINSHPRCNRRELVEALAPTPAPPAQDEGVAATPATSAPEASQPTPEQTAVIADLHWLIHQGHVIEFANGMLETAKKPLPKPPKPEPRQAAKPAEDAPAEVEATSAGSPAEIPPAAPGQPIEHVEGTATPESEAPKASDVAMGGAAASASPSPTTEPVPIETTAAPVESQS